MRHILPQLRKGHAAVGLLALSIFTSPAEALPRKLPPIDECRSDTSFVKFRTALKGIADREDSKALAGKFAPGTSADGHKPRDPDKYVPAEDWAILRGVLRMGCTRLGSERVIPSVSAQLRRIPEHELKDKVLVLDGSKLFGEPYEEKSVRARLAWDIGTAVGTGGDFWTGIRLDDGREGWVSDDNLYWLDPSYRYEIRFEKRRGEWSITESWL